MHDGLAGHAGGQAAEIAGRLVADAEPDLVVADRQRRLRAVQGPGVSAGQALHVSGCDWAISVVELLRMRLDGGKAARAGCRLGGVSCAKSLSSRSCPHHFVNPVEEAALLVSGVGPVHRGLSDAPWGAPSSPSKPATAREINRPRAPAKRWLPPQWCVARAPGQPDTALGGDGLLFPSSARRAQAHRHAPALQCKTRCVSRDEASGRQRLPAERAGLLHLRTRGRTNSNGRQPWSRLENTHASLWATIGGAQPNQLGESRARASPRQN